MAEQVADDVRRFVSLATGAQRTSLSELTLRRWIERGVLHGYKPAGNRRLLIDLNELDELVLAGPVAE